MRLSHIYLAGVAVITLGFVAAAPGAADIQDEGTQPPPPPDEAPIDAVPPPDTPSGVQLDEEQSVEFYSWPVERQAEYQLWPVETQTYYWTLSRERQALFWRLTDEDKIALTAMTGPERDAAWTQLESRAQSSPGP